MKQRFGNKKGKNNISSINSKVEAEDMATEINNFFADIGPRLADSIPDSLLEVDLEFRGDRDIMDEDIRKIMNSISSNKVRVWMEYPLDS